jgi:hypothetical protein
MDEVLNRLNHDELLAVAIVLPCLALALLLGLAGIIGGIWYHQRKLQVEAALKQDMLNRGMPASEIQKVLEATTTKSDEALARAKQQMKLDHQFRHAELQAGVERLQVEAQLKAEMVKRGMAADEIKRVLDTPMGGDKDRPVNAPSPAEANYRS